MSRYRFSTPSPAKLQAYDRRVAAIHEAGHAVVASHLGYGAHAWIHPNVTDSAMGEKTWVGHTTLLKPVGCHSHRAMVAVAGVVAETLWNDGHQADYAEPWGWQDILAEPECMSLSDWDYADHEPGEADEELYDLTAEVANLLMTCLWPSLTGLSRELMRDAARAA